MTIVLFLSPFPAFQITHNGMRLILNFGGYLTNFLFLYSHSRKCSGLSSSPATGKSTHHHIEEIKQSLSTSQPTSQNKLLLSPNMALLKGRGLLQQGSTHPPTLSYTRCLRHVYISDCSVTTLCLAPKTHPSRQNFLIITQASCGDVVKIEGGSVAMGVVKLAPELLLEFDSILCLSGESVSLKERREWWGARAKLDKQLKVSVYCKMRSLVIVFQDI